MPFGNILLFFFEQYKALFLLEDNKHAHKTVGTDLLLKVVKFTRYVFFCFLFNFFILNVRQN